MSRIMNIANGVVNSNENGRRLNVAVHNGKFHLDEILSLILVEMADLSFNIIRTRDPKKITEADICIDVGGSDDGRIFDHHQRNFTRTWDNGVKMAACALVWYDLRDIILDKLSVTNEDARILVSEYIENNLIIPASAVDTGTTGKSDIPIFLPPNLATIVGAYNSYDQTKQDESFQECLSLMSVIINKMIQNWINLAIEQIPILHLMREQIDSEILILDQGGPWIDLTKRNWEEFSHFKITIFPDIANPGEFRLQTFPNHPNEPFSQRCSAPAHWKGLKSGEFQDGPHPDKMVFCHLGGFIAGIKGSKEEAVETALYWIANSSSN